MLAVMRGTPAAGWQAPGLSWQVSRGLLHSGTDCTGIGPPGWEFLQCTATQGGHITRFSKPQQIGSSRKQTSNLTIFGILCPGLIYASHKSATVRHVPSCSASDLHTWWLPPLQTPVACLAAFPRGCALRPPPGRLLVLLGLGSGPFCHASGGGAARQDAGCQMLAGRGAQLASCTPGIQCSCLRRCSAGGELLSCAIAHSAVSCLRQLTKPPQD
jgi:hypothetical protein